ncbi:MAG TPA: zinc-binding dehydrogenase [Solirubrobacteraceae bacterium]|nr:zinc-binding dehydrogenase [Solirubrobacteraceae bacterium]
MRAIVMTHHGGPEVLETRDLPDPVPGPDEVLVRVRAFGLNHADTYMRSGIWSFGIPVLGIECVGLVEDDRSGRFAIGDTVVALVGGLARDRNGSYAELVTVPAANVVAVATDLAWPDLAAIPEVYATAWVALHGNLAIQQGQILLVRGATSAVGQAAVNLAVDAGATVIATTRTAARAGRLEARGAAEVLIDDGRLAAQIRATRPDGVDAVLDLVGNSVLRDSLQCAASHGRVCQIGFLGGLDPVPDFNPLADLPSGVALSTFASAFVLGGDGFPVTDVPIQAIVEKAERGVFDVRPARVFAFDEIVDAHRAMDAGEAGGKLVVTV